MTFVEGSEECGDLTEVRSSGVRDGQRFYVVRSPDFRPINLDLFYQPALGRPGTVDRDGQPLLPLYGLDLIAVAPTVLVVLNIIVEDEKVCSMDLVENSAPGDVGRLQDDYIHGRSPPTFSDTTYGGRSMIRSNIRAMYSPKMPRANNCAPPKMEIKEARNGKPGKLPADK